MMLAERAMLLLVRISAVMLLSTSRDLDGYTILVLLHIFQAFRSTAPMHSDLASGTHSVFYYMV